MSAGISGSYTVLSAPTISSVSRAISSGGIADGRSVESAVAGFASVLVSSVIASPEQILRFEQRLRKASIPLFALRPLTTCLRRPVDASSGAPVFASNLCDHQTPIDRRG